MFWSDLDLLLLTEEVENIVVQKKVHISNISMPNYVMATVFIKID
jgi:hypothetical protein